MKVFLRNKGSDFIDVEEHFDKNGESKLFCHFIIYGDLVIEKDGEKEVLNVLWESPARDNFKFNVYHEDFKLSPTTGVDEDIYYFVNRDYDYFEDYYTLEEVDKVADVLESYHPDVSDYKNLQRIYAGQIKEAIKEFYKK